MKYELKEPFTKDKLEKLRAGDTVLLTGTIYAARDAAHKKLIEMIQAGEPLPLQIENQMVYYMGPTPARPGHPIGSAGPTTSYRMDSFTPALLALGLSGMIGKGPRNDEVKKCAKEQGAVYFAAIGGAAALIAQSIKASEVVAFADMGTEAVRSLYVEDMPLVVAYDTVGGDVFGR
ncbi:MAG: Fe-S-containing hydro-lyase [Clostridiales bacterium]|nr:Fe-S-containing hydro-lyase [Clostridiales bacterium]